MRTSMLRRVSPKIVEHASRFGDFDIIFVIWLEKLLYRMIRHAAKSPSLTQIYLNLTRRHAAIHQFLLSDCSINFVTV